MTYDELLKLIDDVLNDNEYEDYQPWNALRAVVELHKPMYSGPLCQNCSTIKSEWYPCLTIQAIEKELS